MDIENGFCFQKASQDSYAKDLGGGFFISSPKTAFKDGIASPFACIFTLSFAKCTVFSQVLSDIVLI